MSQKNKIDKELEELIKKFEEQNPHNEIWEDGNNKYTLMVKQFGGYIPIKTLPKTKALKSLRRMVK